MTGNGNKPARHPKLDGNVSKNWEPVATLEKRPKKMPFSDRLYFWLLALGGLAMIAAGAALFWFRIGARFGVRIGIYLMVGGLIMFALSTPSMARRNGYRI